LGNGAITPFGTAATDGATGGMPALGNGIAAAGSGAAPVGTGIFGGAKPRGVGKLLAKEVA